MEQEFTFTADRDFNFLRAFAERFDLPVTGNQVIIPPAMGSGYLRQIQLGNGLTLCLQRYQLRQALVVKRLHSTPHELLVFKFTGDESPAGDRDQPTRRHSPTSSQVVQVASGSLFAQELFPADTTIHFTVLTISPQDLLALLALDETNRTRWHLLTGSKSFVLYEAITPEMRRSLTQLAQVDEGAPLARLLYRTKVQELLYALFVRLLARAPTPTIAVGQADAERIFALEAAVLTDLSVPPQLPALARQSGLSLTKMKQLFRQVFGASIYDYYQAARLREAARLLHSLSVAETGYALGFTNLSHFARLFEKYYQVKPKQYQTAPGAGPPAELVGKIG